MCAFIYTCSLSASLISIDIGKIKNTIEFFFNDSPSNGKPNTTGIYLNAHLNETTKLPSRYYISPVY